MKIVVPNSAFLSNIGGFLRKMERDDPSRLDISFHEKWISGHPFVLSLIASAAARARRNCGSCEGIVPPIQSMNYLTRMKLFDFLGLAPPREITEHESAGKVIPVTQIRDSDELHNFITRPDQNRAETTARGRGANRTAGCKSAGAPPPSGAQGSLGLLALGAVRLQAWRRSRRVSG
jgi:hypothetical protein